MDIKCYICNKSCIDITSTVKHLKLAHNLYENSNLELKCCGISCPHSFSTYSGMRRHMQKCKFLIVPSVQEHNVRIISQNITIDNITVDHVAEAIPQPVNQEESLSDEKIKNMSGTFLSNLSSLGLPASTVDKIVSSTKEVILPIVEDTMNYVKESFDQSEKVNTVLQKLSSTSKLFSGLESKYLRHKYISNHYNLTEPKELSVGFRYDRVWDKTLGVYVQRPKNCTFMYIPLLGTLQWLLQHVSVQNYLLRDKLSRNYVLSDFNDGENYKNSEFFQNNPYALQIQIFFDEFETVNPLGSKTGIHKIGAFYFVIRNLPPHQNSSLDCIFLLALCHTADIKRFGFDSVLKPIVEDLKNLEINGIEVDFIPGQPAIKGTLVALTHDNLGANSLYGFVESFSANNFCRFCTVSKQNIDSVFIEDENTLRTKDTHESHCNIAKENNSIIVGVKRNCIFNDLNYFHICDSPSVDIMHDILEGIAQYEMKIMIKYFIQRKLFTVDELNNRVRNFDYGFIERRNRPSFIDIEKSGHNIGQRAAQAWCLCRYLPLIIGDLVVEERDKKVWKILLLLLSIMDIVFAPVISIGMTLHLRDLIHEHHKTFKKCFPEEKILPKHHFLIHYPRVIRKLGPLIYLWAMRCEAKHFYFKKLAASLNNFINICKTLSNRHQEFIAFNWGNKQLNLGIEVSSGKVVSVSKLNHCNLITDYFDLDSDVKVLVTSAISYGYQFKTNYIVCTGFDDRDFPKFGLIRCIFVFDKRPFFVVENYNTVDFSEHYHSYEVCATSTYCIIDIKSLSCPLPMERHQVYNSTKWFVTPRFLII